ncbi:hypothetical protein [Vibrio variabilis]|uniref:hypothetical protein n=1 Tax=Vibrio variabilis TaxID=990271 RepID=UPI000DD6DDA5|nr:hypothetical protein [Vibrio variabilis]
MTVEAIQQLDQQLGKVNDRLKVNGIDTHEFLLLTERKAELEKRKKAAITKLRKDLEGEAGRRIKQDTELTQRRCDNANAFTKEVADQLEVIQSQLESFEQLAEVLGNYRGGSIQDMAITGGSSNALNKDVLVRAVLGAVFNALEVRANGIDRVMPVSANHFTKEPLEMRLGMLKEFSCEVDEQAIKQRVEQATGVNR